MRVLKGGLVGCGFFAPNHLHAWREVHGAEICAVCDLDEGRASEVAERFKIASRYTNLSDMLAREALDFVDIVTQPASHRELVEQAASHRVPVICQKPLAPSLEDARAMVAACESAGIPFMVHENFRWQTPMLAVKKAAGSIGALHFGRISFRSGFDVYAVQPYLATDQRFIIFNLGVHLLDLARFFFGEARALTCHMQRVNPRIQAEDVATILLEMENDAACVAELSYASRLEEELFPQTLVHLEGSFGSVSLGPNFHMTTTASGVARKVVAPRKFAWTSLPARVIQDSVVAIQQHWADCLLKDRPVHTSGADNLKTMELVFAAYESAERKATVKVGSAGAAE